MRVDTKPFDDIRVRKAMNLAVDKEAVIKAFYGGNAEMLGFPMHPDWTGYYEPLSESAVRPIRPTAQYLREGQQFADRPAVGRQVPGVLDAAFQKDAGAI